jgi:ankyrin repeat protein
MGISYQGMGRALLAAAALAVLATPVAAQQYSDGFTFLKAVRERDGNKVTALLGQPGSVVVNTRERSTGDGAIHIVTRERDLTWLTFMLGKGARPDLQTNSGQTALHIAAQLGWLDGAQALLDRRAGVDVANSNGETPLILAVHRRDVPMVRLLLARGANPKRTDRLTGSSAIDYARRDSRDATLLKMLEAPPAAKRAVAGPKL